MMTTKNSLTFEHALRRRDETARIGLLHIFATMDTPAHHVCNLCHESVSHILSDGTPIHEEECPPVLQDRRLGCPHSSYLRQKLIDGLNLLCIYHPDGHHSYDALRVRIQKVEKELQRLDHAVRSLTMYLSDLAHRPQIAQSSPWHEQLGDSEAGRKYQAKLEQDHRKILGQLFRWKKVIADGLEHIQCSTCD